MNQGPTSGDSPEHFSFYAAPANVGPSPEFTIDDLRALAEKHADTCGGAEYAAHKSDSASDKFSYSDVETKARTEITYVVERDRPSPAQSPNMYHYNLRVEYAEVIPESQRVPALIALAADAVASGQFEADSDGATFGFVKISHTCCILDSQAGYEFHTEFNYVIDGVPIYYNEDGQPVVGIDYESDDIHENNKGLPIPEDDTNDETDDEADSQNRTTDESESDIDPFAFLEQSFADSELERKLRTSRKMFELIMARKPADDEFRAHVGMATIAES